MATPHIAVIAALIKQKHPDWSPSAITSAMMTTADVTYKNGALILAQDSNHLSPASPFDFGAGFVNPSKAIDPGLVFDISFKDYVQFLCSVPGLDEKSVSQEERVLKFEYSKCDSFPFNRGEEGHSKGNKRG